HALIGLEEVEGDVNAIRLVEGLEIVVYGKGDAVYQKPRDGVMIIPLSGYSASGFDHVDG
ncbi:hypothetical protein, partial [Pseudomonas kurunegalensis]|uniref:hypothetical protein n=1 Tax=Pseudomonas kurunegalensis TaxID=485880 RepID=UPI003A898717